MSASAPTDPMNDLLTNGFVVFPGVLTAREISRLRAQVSNTLDEQGIDKAGGTVLPNAAAEAQEIGWIFSHPSIIARVREATGLDEMVFTMEADLHRNFLASHWHKDSGEQVMDRGYFDCDAIVSDECRVYKVALYLQDHLADGGSLHVRPGSINTADLALGPDHPISVRAGDLLLFDVRITHRGVSPGFLDQFLLGMAKLSFPRDSAPFAARLRRRRLRLVKQPDRLAVYFAFGKPNDASYRFAKRNMKRQLTHLGRESSRLPAELIKSFNESGIKTVDL